MKTRVLAYTIVGSVVVVATPSCSFREMSSDALVLSDRYYAALGGDRLDAVPALYSPHFFETTSRDKLLADLTNLRDRCGTATSHSMVAVTVINGFGSDELRANVVYDVRYARCRSTERISIVKVGSGDSKIDSLAAHIDPAPPIAPAPREPISTTA